MLPRKGTGSLGGASPGRGHSPSPSDVATHAEAGGEVGAQWTTWCSTETQFRGDTGIHGKEFHTQTQPVGSGNLPSGPASSGSRSHMSLSTCMFFMRKELTVFVIEAVFSLLHHKPLRKLPYIITFHRCAVLPGRTDT